MKKMILSLSLLFSLAGWARNEDIPSDCYALEKGADEQVTIPVNGTAVDYTAPSGYAVLNKTWNKGAVEDLQLPMDVRRVVSSDKVSNSKGSVALQRGPLVNCAAWVDYQGKTSNLTMPSDADFTTGHKSEMLNGVVVVQSSVPAVHVGDNGENISVRKQVLTAIPYYSWANRGKGEMQLWFPEKIQQVQLPQTSAA